MLPFQGEKNNSIHTMSSGQMSKLFYASVHAQTASIFWWRQVWPKVYKYSGTVSKTLIYKYKLQQRGFVLQLEVISILKKSYEMNQNDGSFLAFELSGKGSWGKI